jgi:3'-phosphoadenosine 5'-phosphosulfate sulfotransferase (PAPS reductase)/FAD synthetase
MKIYNSLNEFIEYLNTLPITANIQDAFIKAWGKIHGYGGGDSELKLNTAYPNIMASISGGSDSDIVIDMIERIGHPLSKIHYIFFDTGLKFKATKEHLNFLEQKYDIKIERRRAVTPVPVGVKKWGVPFLNKRASDYISRLQAHNFQWEDDSFERLYAKYPNCKTALRWWCNAWGEKSNMNIQRNRWLKEFIIENPPDFKISAGCCNGAKKSTAHKVEQELCADLNIQGVRKVEGGVRASAYTSCFDDVKFGMSKLRPVFWFNNEDKTTYENVFSVTHSDCYKKYGLVRTGCACCPFGRNFETELKAAKKFEPQLYKAASNVFGKSYEYTRKYQEYRTKMNE